MRAWILVLAIATATCCVLLGSPSGCTTDTISGSAVVGGGFNLPPNVVITADVTRGIAPLTVRFSSSDSTDDRLIVSRRWDFGDGTTSQEISPIHTFQTTGVFVVTLTLTDDAVPAASASRSIEIAVTNAPVARISVDRTSSETAPAVFVFDASGSDDPDREPNAPNNGIVSYLWEFGDGTTEVLPSVAHTYARPGAYRAELTVTDATGIQGKALVVIDVGIARPAIEFLSPPSTIQNIVIPQDAVLWTHVDYEVERGVPHFVRAGLDRDLDECEAQAVVYSTDNGGEDLRLTGHEDRVLASQFSPDGTTILTSSADGTMRLHDAATGELILTYTGNDSAVTAIGWALDGTQFAVGLEDGRVMLRDAQTGAILQTFALHSGAINAVEVSPGGTQLASVSTDRRVLLWDIATAQVLREYVGHDLSVTDVAFSNELMATSSIDGTVRLWDRVSGAELLQYAGHDAPVYSVAFSPDQTQILSGGGDNSAHLWNVTDGSLVRTFVGHTLPVVAVAYSPDGTQVATGSRDWSAKLWNAQTGELEQTLAPCASIISDVDFSNTGDQLVIAVATSSDLQLDSADVPNGNDLNLTTPQPLDLAGAAVEPGTYFLWAEVATDRTQPSRVYAQTLVQVVEPFTGTVGTDTPRVSLYNNEVAVVVAPSTRRQIFDIGTLSRGDRLFFSFMTQPGYDEYYSELEFPSTINNAVQTVNEGTEIDGFYSVMVLDREQRAVTWYQGAPDPNAPNILFTPDAKLLIGTNSSSHYFVTDTATSVKIRVERVDELGLSDEELETRLAPRQQRVYLDFTGADVVNVAGELPVLVRPFNDILADFYPDPNEIDNLIKPALVQRVRTLLIGYDVEVTTSDEGPPPAQPYQTVYFGGTFTTEVNWLFSGSLNAPYVYTRSGSWRVYDLGRADYIDPRNETLTGTAIVGLEGILNVTGTLSPTLMGLVLGNATGHEMGFLMGLRRTEDQDLTSNDIMDLIQLWDDGNGNLGTIVTTAPEFTEGALRPFEQYNTPAIGTQDAAVLLEELFGTE